MNDAISPTVAIPPTASQPPVQATTARPKLLTMFINGPMKLVSTRARNATFCKRRLMIENCAVVAASRTKACTTRSPVTVSSTTPFSSPSAAWVSRKPTRVRAAIWRVMTTVSGITIRLTIASGTLITNISTTTPITPTRLAMS